MKARLIIVGFLLGALAAAVGYHVRLHYSVAAAAAEKAAAQTRLNALRSNADALEKEIAATQAKLQALRHARGGSDATGRSETRTTQARRTSSKVAGNISDRQTFAVATTQEIRALKVRVFVGEQRLVFAGILHRLGLTPHQLERFDAIQAEYQEAELDLANAAAAQGVTNPRDLAALRRQLVQSRDTQLRELFGAKDGAWQEATRTQGARVVVGQLLEQAFQSTGPIDNAQTKALTALVERHAHSGNGGAYDWDAIESELPTILPAPQSAAIKKAIALKRLANQMNTLTTGRKY